MFLDRVEDAEGQLLLSKKKADFLKIWARIGEIYKDEEIVRGRIMRRIKGGFVVDLMTVDAFLPGSQIDVHPVRDFDALVGQDMDFRIVKLNDARKNIVVSHKIIVEKSLAGIREKVLGELKVGDIMEGTVKNITDFGVFVDLGGVDGLLHITDLSWGRVSHPSEVVQLDQKITVKVLDYDKDRQRISIGLKQLQPHPWEGVETKYPVGSRVRGRVVSIARYGAFVELEKGLEGLVHISEMSWTQHVKHPSALLSVGDEIDVVVLNIDKENRKISLGLKQVEPDPWENLETKYAVGSRHVGRVRDLVPFGAFIELEDGIDGLVHISDLSWTRRVRHPGEVLKKGEQVEVVVLGFDRNERRIALGLKQAQMNPWEEFEQTYAVGTQTTGKVARVLEKGVVVELPKEVEGFVPNSQLKRVTRGGKQSVNVGDELQLEVIEFDRESKKIILAAQAPLSEPEAEPEDEAYRQYIVGSDTEAAPRADDVPPSAPKPRLRPNNRSPKDAAQGWSRTAPPLWLRPRMPAAFPPNTPRRVAISTFGCKLNQVESEAILTQFRAAGYDVAETADAADVHVVNTCAVTATAERKARSLLRGLHRRNPGAQVLAVGCMAERTAETLAKIEGVAAVLGNREKEHILDFLPRQADTGTAEVHVGETQAAVAFGEGLAVDGLLGRTRSFLKVQDGCSQKCTYCIIPQLRGRGRSLEIPQVVEQARRLADHGFTEIVITGVALGTYGFDLGLQDGLASLLAALESVPGLQRVRLGSVEPWAISERLLSTIADSAVICPHLHIPLQSAEDTVLHRMNRRYTTAEIQHHF